MGMSVGWSLSKDPRYPIGKFVRPMSVSPEERAELLDVLAATPSLLRGAVTGLSDDQLDTPYRLGGWTVRQVVHHMADSHMNSYIRCRLALTEDAPLIKPYEQAKWAELADARTLFVEPSLALLENLHARWVALLRSLNPEDFARTFRHPEYADPMSLDANLALYAWHGMHHTTHITGLRQRMGW
jgi:uncharacterized damage-inducible protein DinB